MKEKDKLHVLGAQWLLEQLYSEVDLYQHQGLGIDLTEGDNYNIYVFLYEEYLLKSELDNIGLSKDPHGNITRSISPIHTTSSAADFLESEANKQLKSYTGEDWKKSLAKISKLSEAAASSSGIAFQPSLRKMFQAICQNPMLLIHLNELYQNLEYEPMKTIKESFENGYFPTLSSDEEEAFIGLHFCLYAVTGPERCFRQNDVQIMSSRMGFTKGDYTTEFFLLLNDFKKNCILPLVKYLKDWHKSLIENLDEVKKTDNPIVPTDNINNRYARHYVIGIFSPGSTENERDIVRRKVVEWNEKKALSRGICLTTKGWENSQIGPGRPQDLLNATVVDPSDMCIAIFSTRLGTQTGKYNSGTVEEIRRSMQAGKMVKLFFKSKDSLLKELEKECQSKSEYFEKRTVLEKNYEEIQLFQKECKEEGENQIWYGSYQNEQEFSNEVYNQLDLWAEELDGHKPHSQ